MNFAVHLPLEVSEPDARSLEGQSRILNWAHNHLLETANTLKAEWIQTQDPKLAKVIYSEKGLRDLLPELKKKYPFLCAVHSVPLKNAALRLSESIRRYQDNKRKEKKHQIAVGWPKFRSCKKKFYSLLFDELGNGFQLEQVPQQGWYLILSLGTDAEQKRLKLRLKIREMPLWLSRSMLDAKNKYAELRNNHSCESKDDRAERKKLHLRKLMPFTQLRIKRTGNQWSAILSVEKPQIRSQEPVHRVAVIDPNHKNLGYLVDHQGKAIEIQNIPKIKRLDQRIDEIKQRRDRCKRSSVQVKRTDGSVFYQPSRKWKFFQKYLDELQRLRREQIKLGLYTISNFLADQYDLLAIGNYTPQGGGISRKMRRAMNQQSQIGKFKQVASWVFQKHSKIYHEWDERNSTKTCHHCAEKTELTQDPGVRSWQCQNCQTKHIRDENAAQNGSKSVMEWIKQNNVPCSGQLEAKVKSEKHFAVTSRWTWRFNGSGISVSRAIGCV